MYADLEIAWSAPSAIGTGGMGAGGQIGKKTSVPARRFTGVFDELTIPRCGVDGLRACVEHKGSSKDL